MDTFLDLEHWPRRASFDHFRGFDKPYFNVCTRLDVARLQPAVAAAGGGFTLACCFIALQLANRQEALRLRLEGGRVRVYDVVDGSTTVLRGDDSFGFAALRWDAGFGRFKRDAQAAIDAARSPGAGFAPQPDAAAVVHFTSLPWVHFSSFSHARNWGREDAVPKIAFGRVDADGSRRWMPLSVEVHHALVDGVHVGRFIEGFEAALLGPLDWLHAA